MQLQFKLFSTQFKVNNWINIQLKRNDMQIGGEGIKNLLVNMVFKKKTFKKDT